MKEGQMFLKLHSLHFHGFLVSENSGSLGLGIKWDRGSHLLHDVVRRSRHWFAQARMTTAQVRRTTAQARRTPAQVRSTPAQDYSSGEQDSSSGAQHSSAGL